MPRSRSLSRTKTVSIDRSGKKLLTREKQRQALELRKAGATYNMIADQVGYNDASAARKAVVRAFHDVIQEPVQEVRILEIERLNHMLLILWPRIQSGDDTAMHTALRIMDKIDRIYGTEAPAQVQVQHEGVVIVADGEKEDYIAALRKMAENVIPARATEITETLALEEGEEDAV